MTIRQTFTCDEPGCGVETNGERSIALPYELRRPDVEFLPDHLHGCTKEHLGLAVAAQFGIPTDATVEQVMQLETKLADLETKLSVVTKDWMAARTDADNQKELSRRTNAELGAASDRIAELEARLAKQTPLVDATGKTPGEVLSKAFDEYPGDTIDAAGHEFGAQAVLSAFGNQRATEVLLALENRITQDGCRIFTGSKGAVEAIDVAAAMVRAELAKLEGADTPAETSEGKSAQEFTRARYEALAGEALFDAYVRPLAHMGFVVQRPRSVHWGTVTDVIRAAISALVEPDAS